MQNSKHLSNHDETIFKVDFLREACNHKHDWVVSTWGGTSNTNFVDCPITMSLVPPPRCLPNPWLPVQGLKLCMSQWTFDLRYRSNLTQGCLDIRPVQLLDRRRLEFYIVFFKWSVVRIKIWNVFRKIPPQYTKVSQRVGIPELGRRLSTY